MDETDGNGLTLAIGDLDPVGAAAADAVGCGGRVLGSGAPPKSSADADKASRDKMLSATPLYTMIDRRCVRRVEVAPGSDIDVCAERRARCLKKVTAEGCQPPHSSADNGKNCSREPSLVSSHFFSFLSWAFWAANPVVLAHGASSEVCVGSAVVTSKRASCMWDQPVMQKSPGRWFPEDSSALTSTRTFAEPYACAAVDTRISRIPLCRCMRLLPCLQVSAWSPKTSKMSWHAGQVMGCGIIGVPSNHLTEMTKSKGGKRVPVCMLGCL